MNQHNLKSRTKMQDWALVGTVLAVCAALALFFFGEDSAEAGSWILLLLLLACPLMMLFMMRGMNRDSDHDKDR